MKVRRHNKKAFTKRAEVEGGSIIQIIALGVVALLGFLAMSSLLIAIGPYLYPTDDSPSELGPMMYGYSLATIDHSTEESYQENLTAIHTNITNSNCTAVAIGIHTDMTQYWSIWARIRAEVNFSRSLPQVEHVYVVYFNMNPDWISRARMLDFTNLTQVDAIAIDCGPCWDSYTYVPTISMDTANLTVWLLEFNSIAKMRGMDFAYYQGDGLYNISSTSASVLASAGLIAWADLDVNGSLAWGSSHIDWTYPRIWINFWISVAVDGGPGDFQPHSYASIIARHEICKTHPNVEAYYMCAIVYNNRMPEYAEQAIEFIAGGG